MRIKTEISSSKKSQSGSSEDQAKQIKTLLKLPQSKELTPNEDATRLDSIRRLFQKLAHEMLLEKSSSVRSTAHAQKWSDFLKKHHRVFVEQLRVRIRPTNATNAGKKYALRVFFGVLTYMNYPGRQYIDEECMYKLIISLTGADLKEDTEQVNEIDDSLLSMLQVEFLEPYNDVRYFCFVALRKIANEATHGLLVLKEEAVINLFLVLSALRLPTADDLYSPRKFLVHPPEHCEELDEDLSSGEDSDEEEEHGSDEDESDSDDQNENGKRNASSLGSTHADKRGRNLPFMQRLSRYRKVHCNCWLAVLKMPHISLRLHKLALKYLSSDQGLSNMSTPLRFADYFIESYEYGGVTSLLALNGLFSLMTEHDLEYEDFYDSLYSLITCETCYAKHRVRLFRLLNTCLSSSQMLPAYVVAAFIKRLSRTALSSPPSVALFVLALVSNLIRKHKACRVLISRDDDSGNKLLEDKYDPLTNKTAECRGKLSSYLIY